MANGKVNLVDQLTGFLGNIVSEDNGNASSMRIITLIIVGTVLFNWTYHNITTGTLTGFDYNELIALLGPLGFKVWQKGKESNGPTNGDEEK